MTANERLISKLVVDLLSQRKDVVKIACRQRAKFEGWLKFELAAALNRKRSVSNVEVEKPYGQKSKCDLVFGSSAGLVFVELKTANTNWRVKGVENQARPITKNVNDVITDIEKLRTNMDCARGVAVFTFFPVPEMIWRSGKGICKHLARIEHEAELPSGRLRNAGRYVGVATQYGIVAFVVDVTNTSSSDS